MQNEYALTHDVNDLVVGETDITIKQLAARQREDAAKVRSGEIDNGLVNGVPGPGFEFKLGCIKNVRNYLSKSAITSQKRTRKKK